LFPLSWIWLFILLFIAFLFPFCPPVKLGQENKNKTQAIETRIKLMQFLQPSPAVLSTRYTPYSTEFTATYPESRVEQRSKLLA
jgi:hypothetical protein